jgi:ATP-dependent exoDNAse (exonuclease V) beta subunit
LDSNGNPVTPFSQKPLIEAVKLRTEDEARRLFYVGMTRAREYLTMCGCHKSSKGNSRSNGFREPLKWLATTIGLALDAHEPTVCTVDGATIHVRFITEESVAAMRGAFATHDPKLLEARKQVSQNRAVVWEPPSVARGERIDATIRDILVTGQISSPASRPNAVTTVTQLVYFARCPLVYYFSLVLQIDEHPRRRRRADSDIDRKLTPAEMGTIVHGMLELADLDAPALDEARRLAQSPSAESMSDADREKVQRMLAGVLTEPLIERARTATRLEREYPFYMSVNGATIRGVIDLVFTDANGHGVVIDYKTNDLAAPDRINVLSRYYEPQIEMYALAASRAGLVQPDEATLYFLNGPEARTTTINGERLATVEATMSDALARISSNAWDTEPGEKCRHCGYRKRGFCEVGKRFVE